MMGSDDTAMHEVEQEARYEEFRRRRERREQLEARFKELVPKQERQKNVSLVYRIPKDLRLDAPRILPPEQAIALVHLLGLRVGRVGASQ